MKTTIRGIEPGTWYKVSRIVQEAWLPNTIGGSYRQQIYRLIDEGKLKARNFGHGKKAPVWMIQGSELIRYIQSTYL